MQQMGQTALDCMYMALERPGNRRAATTHQAPTFQKVEATAEYVLVILRTLYERAGDLGIDAKTRISFHANVLLAAESGFRPGTFGKSLENMDKEAGRIWKCLG